MQLPCLAAAASPCGHYKRNVGIPLPDHIITHSQELFSISAIVASPLLGLVPSVLCTREVSLQQAIDQYYGDLPSPELNEKELKRWKNHCVGQEMEEPLCWGAC